MKRGKQTEKKEIKECKKELSRVRYGPGERERASVCVCVCERERERERDRERDVIMYGKKQQEKGVSLGRGG